MFRPKKLVKMASAGRRRISSSSSSCSSLIAEKGHFVVYTVDHRRFEMPLCYLHNRVFQELFRMSEEEFGLSSDGPITLPCNASFMECVVSLIQRGAGENLEKALLSSVSSSHCTKFGFFQSLHRLRSGVCRAEHAHVRLLSRGN